MKSILSEKSYKNQVKCEVVSKFQTKSFSNLIHFEILSPHMHRTYLQMNLQEGPFTIANVASFFLYAAQWGEIIYEGALVFQYNMGSKQ